MKFGLGHRGAICKAKHCSDSEPLRPAGGHELSVERMGDKRTVVRVSRCWELFASATLLEQAVRENTPMKIHEYQAKEILRKYGVPVPGGEMATTLEEADTAAKSLFGAGNKVVVVKAQIHAGGRGKGGGVKLAQVARRGGCGGEGDPGHAAGDASDGAGGAEGAAAAD